MNDIILSTQNGEPVASSRDVAKTEYVHPQNHQKYPMYLMNRDGFSLLAMGFTGKEAAQ